MIVRWQKNQDYLVIRIYRDLVGDWIVAQSWGNTSSAQGNHRQTIVESFQAARRLLLKINRAQRARGFRRLTPGEEQLGFNFD